MNKTLVLVIALSTVIVRFFFFICSPSVTRERKHKHTNRPRCLMNVPDRQPEVQQGGLFDSMNERALNEGHHLITTGCSR